MKANAELLTTRQTAEWLDVSHRTLENFRIAGRGPKYVKIGRCVRYRARDLKEWLEGLERRSTSDRGAPLRGREKRRRDAVPRRALRAGRRCDRGSPRTGRSRA